MRNALVPPKDAHTPESWHEQACLHLGLKGTVRLCFVGLVLEVGLSLQGHEHDLLAYVDGLIHANVSGTDGIVMPMRHVAANEQRINTLAVTTHHTKKELMQLHLSDIKTFSPFIMPPYSIDIDDDDEVVGRTRGRRSLPAAAPYHQQPALRASSPPPSQSSRSAQSSPPVDALISALPMISVPNHEDSAQRSSRRSVGAEPEATAAALYDYVAAETDELSIVSGEILTILARCDMLHADDWPFAVECHAPVCLHRVGSWFATETDPKYFAHAGFALPSHDDGWYLVQNSNGSFGVVPGNYLFLMGEAARGAHVSATQANEESFLDALRKSQEASRALEASLSALAAVAASPWILRKAPSIPSALALARQEASATRASLADIGAAIAHGSAVPPAQGRQAWAVARAGNSAHAAAGLVGREGEVRENGGRRGESSWGWGDENSSSSDDDMRRRIPRYLQ